VGFEPTISAGEQPQTDALDRAPTDPGLSFRYTTLIRRFLLSDAPSVDKAVLPQLQTFVPSQFIPKAQHIHPPQHCSSPLPLTLLCPPTNDLLCHPPTSPAHISVNVV